MIHHGKDLTQGKIDVITNYLDDFLFIAHSLRRGNKLVQLFLELCDELGVPVADDKTEWSAARVVFLRILLDRDRFILSILEEKRIKALNLLELTISKRKATIKELEKLAGYLNFLNKAIVPGRTFTRCMYAKFSSCKQKLKPHHHVNLDAEFKADCRVWISFLKSPSELTICRPFVDFTTEVTAETLGFYSDATANQNLGYGCIFDSSWTFNQWEPGFIKQYEKQINIEFLELYALCMGIFTWIDRIANRRVVVLCNNQGVVSMINNTTSGCKFCMVLIRHLMLKCMQANLCMFARHVSGIRNILSDSLSCLDLRRFRRHAREINWSLEEYPTDSAEDLWPLSRFWTQHCLSLL